MQGALLVQFKHICICIVYIAMSMYSSSSYISNVVKGTLCDV